MHREPVGPDKLGSRTLARPEIPLSENPVYQEGPPPEAGVIRGSPLGKSSFVVD